MERRPDSEEKTPGTGDKQNGKKGGLLTGGKGREGKREAEEEERSRTDRLTALASIDVFLGRFIVYVQRVT